MNFTIDGKPAQASFVKAPVVSIPETISVVADFPAVIAILAEIPRATMPTGQVLEAKTMVQAACPVRAGQGRFLVKSYALEHSFHMAILEAKDYRALEDWHSHREALGDEEQARSVGIWAVTFSLGLVALACRLVWLRLLPKPENGLHAEGV